MYIPLTFSLPRSPLEDFVDSVHQIQYLVSIQSATFYYAEEEDNFSILTLSLNEIILTLSLNSAWEILLVLVQLLQCRQRRLCQQYLCVQTKSTVHIIL